MEQTDMVAARHSLSEAVKDGTMSAEAAFCGLSPSDMVALAEKHPEANVLVRCRSAHGDGRFIFTALEFSHWAKPTYREQATRYVGGIGFVFGDIRDIMAVAGAAS